MKELMVLTVKNFPVDIHRKAKSAAALQGITLKDLIIQAIKQYLQETDTDKA